MGQDWTPDDTIAVIAEAHTAVFLNQLYYHLASLVIDSGADNALALNLLKEGVKLNLQGNPGEVSFDAAEGGSGGFGDVVHGAVE